MKKLYFMIGAALIANASLAQTQNLGQPLSYSKKVNLTKKGFTLPSVNNSAEHAYYTQLAAERGEKLLQYGKPFDVSINFFQEANKRVLPNGDNLYQYFIESPTAVSLNVIFEKFRLEQGTVMYLFNESKTEYIGAYTSLNNSAAQKLGTELLYSKRIYIEVQEPIENEGKSQLEIGRVIHGFINLDEFVTKSLNDSGDCNIDVNCPQGSGWEIPRNGVAMLVNGGGGFCSGSMVNNTAGTTTPYFLTANHCGDDPTNWVFRFRWESPEGSADCATNAPSVNGPTNMNINGGVTRASYAPSDFHLIELNAVPDQAWEVSYNGWDRTDIPALSGAGIHHPSGDIKKITISSETYVSEAYFGQEENHWHVQWSDGVTEGGSSGSPIFNQYRRVVGQLHGGASYCGGDDLSDSYGKFFNSWTGGGTSSTRLSDWLDPQSTGVDFIDANVTNSLDPFFTSSIIGAQGTLCGGNLTPQVILTNGGSVVMTSATINYVVDGVSTPISWTGNLGLFESETITLPALSLSNGAHTISVTVADPNGTTDENMDNNNVTNSFNVVVGGENLVLEMNLDCYANETSWEIVDNNSTVFFHGGNYVQQENYTVTHDICLNEGCYDLIVYDSYGDGMSSSDCDPGSFNLYDSQQAVLTSLDPADADFGQMTVKNFCVGETNVVDVMGKSTLKVYPNPFQNGFKVSGSELIRKAEILDVTGKSVFVAENIDSNEIILNPVVKSGTYFLVITTDNAQVIEKIVK
ncbi:MAG: T9SS type A sorting domain-containing protein [Bacteroidota bacterium]